MLEYLVMIMVVVIGYWIYLSTKFVNIEVGNKQYQIEKYSPNKIDSLNNLVEVRKRLDTLIHYLEKTTPEDPKVARLKQRFNSCILREANPTGDPNQTSYTINKGAAIVLCLRLETGELVDINTLTYVAIHELTHIYSSSYHHTDEFWKNMGYMETMAIKAGIYQDNDFAKNPKRYCGLTIKTNVPKQSKPTQIGGQLNQSNSLQYLLDHSHCNF